MGLDMKTRRNICARIFRRYQKAGKKGKAKILEEYTLTLGYNRDYLAHPLRNCEKTRYALSSGKPVKFVAKERHQRPCGGKKTDRQDKYHKAFVTALKTIWELFDFQRGNYWPL